MSKDIQEAKKAVKEAEKYLALQEEMLEKAKTALEIARKDEENKRIGELDCHIRDTYGVSPEVEFYDSEYRTMMPTDYFKALKTIAKAIRNREDFIEREFTEDVHEN